MTSTFLLADSSFLDGKGSGEWNKLSVVLPPYVQASISQKAVYKFPENTVRSQTPRVLEHLN